MSVRAHCDECDRTTNPMAAEDSWITVVVARALTSKSRSLEPVELHFHDWACLHAYAQSKAAK